MANKRLASESNRRWLPLGKSLILSLLCVHAAFGQTPVITLDSVVPAGIKIGETVSIKVNGSTLDEADRLIFSHAGISAKVEKEVAESSDAIPRVRYGNFQVTASSDLKPGVHEVSVQGRLGVSNSRPFLVTNESQTLVKQNHSTLQSGFQLEPLQWTHAWFRPRERNYYRFQVEAGESIAIVCLASCLDSRAAPTLTLRNAAGKSVVQRRAIGRGPTELVWKAEKAEEYSLVVNDLLFRGGEDYGYCLFRSGSSNEALNKLEPNVFFPTASVGFDRLLDGSLPILHHEESQSSQPPVVSIPVAIHGKWEHPDDSDSFDFDAKAGEKIYCDVFSESIGQSSDPRFVIDRIASNAAEGTKKDRVHVQDDQPNIGGPPMSLGLRDPRYVFSAPSDGRYRLTMIDQQSDSNAQTKKEYWIRLAGREPTFEALGYFPSQATATNLMKAAGCMLSRGGVVPIRIVARRERGMESPIAIELVNPPPGVESARVIMGANQNEVELMLVASEDAPSWTGKLELTASATVDGKSMQVPVQFATISLDASPELGNPQSRMTSSLLLTVSSLDVAPLLVKAGSNQAIEIVQGAKGEIPIRAIRRAGGDGKFQLKPQNLPPKATMAEVAFEPKVVEGKGELQIHAETPIGDYTLWFLNETKVKTRKNPQSLLRCEEERKSVQQKLADGSLVESERKRLSELDATLAKQVEQLKVDTAEKEYTVRWPTTSILVRVLAK